jgi:CPA2 family monovalent cation:H+ antiporter-2
MLGLEHSGPNLVGGFLERKSTGIIDLLANGIPGAAIGLLMGWGFEGALILGGITFVSSSGIAAQLMKDSGWNRSEVSRRVVTVLVVEDLALAPYLPAVSTLVAGLGMLAGVISTGAAIAITATAIWLSFHANNRFARLINTKAQGALLLSVFGAALIAAGGAELLGFSSAIAAFLVGLVLTGEVAEAVRLRLSPLRDLFSAIFFVFFGLAINPADIPSVLPLALVLTALGIGGKLLVGWYVARSMSDSRAWKRAGAFLVPRGEFSILIAGLASILPFGSAIQTLTMTYVLLTTVSSTILLWAFRPGLDRTPAR